MSTFAPPLGLVLDRINQIAPVDIEDYEDDDEWFYLESNDLEDPELYAKLKSHWGVIVGSNYNRFALLLCDSDPDSGVWLHYFPTLEACAEYLPGCHHVTMW